MKASAILRAASAGLLLGVFGAVSARASVISTNLLTINVTGADGSGSWQLPTNGNYTPGDDLSWTNPSAINIKNTGGDVLASIAPGNLHLSVVDDPQVSVSFVITGGPVAQNFSIGSGLLSFPAISNPSAFATAAVTVTDTNSDGAFVNGNLSGGTKLYRAIYNTSTDWTYLLNSTAAVPTSSASANDRLPVLAPNRQVIPASVSNIGSEFNFQLSAFDQASGTSTFDVPEPACFAVVSAGGLILARRRK